MKRFFSLCSFLFAFTVNAEAPPTFGLIRVATVGDSITEGPGRDNPDSYPLMMQEILGNNYAVRNYGISSRTLLKKGDYPYWKDNQFKQVQAFAPDILVIKLGTNDSKPQNWKHKREFEENYIEMINTFKAAMPEDGQVYICIPVPVFKANWGINEYMIRNEMVPMIHRVAKKTGANVIDLHRPLQGREELFPDGVHPTKEGHRIIAEVVAEEIKRE